MHSNVKEVSFIIRWQSSRSRNTILMIHAIAFSLSAVVTKSVVRIRSWLETQLTLAMFSVQELDHVLQCYGSTASYLSDHDTASPSFCFILASMLRQDWPTLSLPKWSMFLARHRASFRFTLLQCWSVITCSKQLAYEPDNAKLWTYCSSMPE